MKKQKTYYVECYCPNEKRWERYGPAFTNKKEAEENLSDIINFMGQKGETYQLVCETVNVILRVIKKVVVKYDRKIDLIS